MDRNTPQFDWNGARARRTDPDTSHAAADSLKREVVRESQNALLRVMRRIGIATDVDIAREYESECRAGRAPEQSPSGLRTRRKELCEMGFAFDTGRRVKLKSNRDAILWGVHWESMGEEEAREESFNNGQFGVGA